MAALWTFRSYVSVRGVDVIREWYGEQSDRTQAKFVSRLKFLSQTPRPGWKREHFDLLGGKCKGLGEIRFLSDSIQHRPLGFFGPDRAEFTLLICAQEKNGRFVPKDACEIGLARLEEVINDSRRSKISDFPLE